jgi:hypothetical protein
MIRLLALLIAIAAGMFVNSATTGAAPPSQSVTTMASVPWPYGPTSNGSIGVKFVATPNGDGTWIVSATFKPKNVKVAIFFLGTWTLKGSAAGQATAAPGAPAEVVAPGCYWASGGTVVMQSAVTCGFTIDASGVVAISSIVVPPFAPY